MDDKDKAKPEKRVHRLFVSFSEKEYKALLDNLSICFSDAINNKKSYAKRIGEYVRTRVIRKKHIRISPIKPITAEITQQIRTLESILEDRYENEYKEDFKKIFESIKKLDDSVQN